MDNPTCPFCGESFAPFVHMAVAEHPPNIDCPLFGRTLKIEEWNMRPPKKEQPAKEPMSDLTFYLTGEVQWLRERLEILMVPEEPEQRYSIDLGYERKEPDLTMHCKPDEVTK